jgi:hypothetical protein
MLAVVQAVAALSCAVPACHSLLARLIALEVCVSRLEADVNAAAALCFKAALGCIMVAA